MSILVSNKSIFLHYTFIPSQFLASGITRPKRYGYLSLFFKLPRKPDCPLRSHALAVGWNELLGGTVCLRTQMPVQISESDTDLIL